MYYTDDSLLPENQDPLIITAAPYGPIWMPADYPEEVPVSWDEQVQMRGGLLQRGRHGPARPRARSGRPATSRRTFRQYADQIGRLRKAVPKMILQVGGSISFAPEPGAEAAHMAELRHPAHARRDRSEAGSGHSRHRLGPL